MAASVDGRTQHRNPRTVTDNVAQGMELLFPRTGVGLATLLRGITSKAEPISVPEETSAQIEIAD